MRRRASERRVGGELNGQQNAQHAMSLENAEAAVERRPTPAAPAARLSDCNRRIVGLNDDRRLAYAIVVQIVAKIAIEKRRVAQHEADGIFFKRIFEPSDRIDKVLLKAAASPRRRSRRLTS